MILHGWQQNAEDGSWTYGGRRLVATMSPMTGPQITIAGYERSVLVRLWPRLGLPGALDPTMPLGDDVFGGLVFATEAMARSYVESWERAAG